MNATGSFGECPQCGNQTLKDKGYRVECVYCGWTKSECTISEKTCPSCGKKALERIRTKDAGIKQKYKCVECGNVVKEKDEVLNERFSILLFLSIPLIFLSVFMIQIFGFLLGCFSLIGISIILLILVLKFGVIKKIRHLAKKK